MLIDSGSTLETFLYLSSFYPSPSYFIIEHTIYCFKPYSDVLHNIEYK